MFSFIYFASVKIRATCSYLIGILDRNTAGGCLWTERDVVRIVLGVRANVHSGTTFASWQHCACCKWNNAGSIGYSAVSAYANSWIVAGRVSMSAGRNGIAALIGQGAKTRNRLMAVLGVATLEDVVLAVWTTYIVFSGDKGYE